MSDWSGISHDKIEVPPHEYRVPTAEAFGKRTFPSNSALEASVAMIRCKECRWWKAVEDEGGAGCLGIADPHACANPLLGELAEHHGRGRDDLLIYPYGEGGHLLPGPEFGCVHGERP